MEKVPARKWDWLIAILLFLMLQVSAARLVTTNWAKTLYLAQSLAAYGTILGLALGASRFQRRGVLWLSFLYTLVVVPWELSGASEKHLLQDRLAQVGNILSISLGQFMSRQPVKDPLFFVGFVGLIFWLLCILAGFAVARYGSILVGIIPAGAIVVVIQIYANYQARGSWWLGMYLLFALLLLGRSYFLQNQQSWLEKRVYVHDEAWTNILGGLVTVVAAAIFVGWSLPSPISSVRGASDAWSRMTRSMRDRLSNAVTSLNGPNTSAGANFFGPALGLGQNAAVGDSTVFFVKVMVPPENNPPRYYWRARVYDTYTSGGWSVSPNQSLGFTPPATSLTIADTGARSQAQLLFTLQFPSQSLIYSPAEMVWMDKPATVLVTPAGVSGGKIAWDVLSWEAQNPFSNGGQYQVRAQIANPTVEQLRAAPAAYPPWVEEHDFDVPSSVVGPIRALARQVTAGAKTPYDKAQAITNYLRSEIQYSTQVPPAPDGQDPVEWVLFDYKKGFCNYYASAEVLMLRSVGVPARLAVGFAQGDYINGAYQVHRRDAHAWPEVFFPGLGWVEFEPTASQNALVRFDTSAQSPANGSLRDPNAKLAQDPGNLPDAPAHQSTSSTVPFVQTLAGRLLAIALSLIAAVLIVYLVYRYHVVSMVPVALDRAFVKSGLTTPAWITGWLRWNRLQPVEKAFAPINWSLRWYGKRPPVHASHAERAATLKKLMPLAIEPIDVAASELETGLFTPHAPDVQKARRAGLMVLVHYFRARLTRLLGI